MGRRDPVQFSFTSMLDGGASVGAQDLESHQSTDHLTQYLFKSYHLCANGTVKYPASHPFIS